MPCWHFFQADQSFFLQEKSQNSGGEFTLDIYVKEKNDNPCRPKVISLHIVCTFWKITGVDNKEKKQQENIVLMKQQILQSNIARNV